jgi:hypothetical protein
MKKKAALNYWIDVISGIAFAVAAVSGIVLLFAGSGGGYYGGRNRGHAASVLSLSRWFWKDLHDWSAVLAVAGVLGHFVLHWDWLACMTRNLFRRGASRARAIEACPGAT